MPEKATQPWGEHANCALKGQKGSQDPPCSQVSCSTEAPYSK